MRKHQSQLPATLRTHPWLIALVCVNVVILAAWLWSRDGQTTVLRVEIIGDHYRATIDGNVLIDRDVDAPANGGIELLLDPVALPSLPSSRGFDRITDKDSARRLRLVAILPNFQPSAVNATAMGTRANRNQCLVMRR